MSKQIHRAGKQAVAKHSHINTYLRGIKKKGTTPTHSLHAALSKALPGGGRRPAAATSLISTFFGRRTQTPRGHRSPRQEKSTNPSPAPQQSPSQNGAGTAAESGTLLPNRSACLSGTWGRGRAELRAMPAGLRAAPRCYAQRRVRRQQPEKARR